ncbi:putative FBD-associated F-box protein [Raphanus sativus]|uniref:Probable FBD-associated F-box protein At1g32375 n=1 Tax=Raphanus sativus TaxID=3726 RepID=A0A6J0MJ63_RAPSA|nr:probable FBD-associated F-box protein At1g32375 [Raphanus sativus]XP_018472551.1 probable FBD-associated F-box protein At1g32375 [Raphanus sativus]KAJ4905708.1 putative FBD-associated F-box protein [Raphanus sativus]
MDRISHLPEHLLLKILSFLPSTKDVVATMVLSKRWQFLWTLVPRLVYDDDDWNTREEGSFSRFVNISLLLHEAPVLESLQFNLGENSSDVDIGVWARTVSRRHVRELVIEIDRSSCTERPVLPKSLYLVSGMLVKLKLENVILAADVSSTVSFPSLKELSLVSIKYPGGDESVTKLLSNCPVLEDLFVDRWPDDNVTVFTVRVPSLKILYLCDAPYKDSDNGEGIVIGAPSLETFTILDCTDGFFIIENEMPNIVKARIDVFYGHSGKILGSITPVKHLCLCLSSFEHSYPGGCVFHRLVNFTLCRCDKQWLNLLMCVLRDSPKLQTLKLDQHHSSRANQPKPSPCCSEPSLVPECLISSLETLEWVDYEGTKEEKEVVEFILRNGRCLRKVTISSKPTAPEEKLEMIKELTLSFRRSPICQLVFN